MGDGTWPARARGWIGRPVRLGAAEVGVVSDVIANRSLGHVLGFEVSGGADSCGRFLPWVAAEVEGEDVRARSVYALLSPADLTIYLDGGVRLGERRDDLLVDRHGDVAALEAQWPEDVPSGDAHRSAA